MCPDLHMNIVANKNVQWRRNLPEIADRMFSLPSSSSSCELYPTPRGPRQTTAIRSYSLPLLYKIRLLPFFRSQLALVLKTSNNLTECDVVHFNVQEQSSKQCAFFKNFTLLKMKLKIHLAIQCLVICLAYFGIHILIIYNNKLEGLPFELNKGADWSYKLKRLPTRTYKTPGFFK